MKIMISDICEAFKSKAVGSRVKKGYRKQFMAELEKAISNHDFSKDRVPGQAVIELPYHIVRNWVFPGTWWRSRYAEKYVVREYRNEVGMYLKRTPKMNCDNVSCVVYTKDAYINDPDFTEEEGVRMNKFFGKSKGYVLVAVLGNPSWSKSTVSYSRFVKNLAGANNEYKVMSKKEIVDLAKKVVENRGNFIGVAD